MRCYATPRHATPRSVYPHLLSVCLCTYLSGWLAGWLAIQHPTSNDVYDSLTYLSIYHTYHTHYTYIHTYIPRPGCPHQPHSRAILVNHLLGLLYLLLLLLLLLLFLSFLPASLASRRWYGGRGRGVFKLTFSLCMGGWVDGWRDERSDGVMPRRKVFQSLFLFRWLGFTLTFYFFGGGFFL